MSDNRPVMDQDGDIRAFNIGKLTISIFKSFAHKPEEASFLAGWLAITVEQRLNTEVLNVTTDEIAAQTHDVLKHYDEAAALQYALQHKLIKTARRRGRPPLSSPR